jgi:mannosyltransferase
MKAGCPVIALNSSSLPEVVGDAGLLVERAHPKEFLDTLQRLENVDFRNELIKRGLKQGDKFSWDTCFEETIKFYQDVLRQHVTAG